jgi:putative SOS response-associated peptidase YedK
MKFMCGRFSQSSSIEVIAAIFGIETVDPPPRYNIAPTQSVAAILESSHQPHLHWLQWGLIPSWAKDPKIGSKLINARAETVMEKPSFRTAFRHRRCLIPADGFYEWQQVEGSKQKQPYLIGLQDGQPFAFAGLYERWESPSGDILATCTIITTTANQLVEPIHGRMPVIVAPQDYDRWLDTSFDKRVGEEANIAKIKAILAPYPAEAMQLYPVGSIVNNPKNDRPECKQLQLL